MEITIVKTTYEELDHILQFVLELQKKPFFFVRSKGVLYMNKNMGGIDKLTAAVETMWKHDFADSQEILDALDAAHDTVSQLAGEEAAAQLNREWHEAASESRKAKAKAKAIEWMAAVFNEMGDEEWNEICDAGYDVYFVQDGLPKVTGYGRQLAEAAFVYGFQLGKQTVKA